MACSPRRKATWVLADCHPMGNIASVGFGILVSHKEDMTLKISKKAKLHSNTSLRLYSAKVAFSGISAIRNEA